jgi:hypothetical protein
VTKNMNLIENGIQVEGKVIGLSQNNNSDGARMYYPVVQFILENGSPHTKQVAFGSNPAAYDVGANLSILYYKEDPDSAVINSSFWMYGFPGIFIGIGIILDLILIIILIVSKKNKLTVEQEVLNYVSGTEDENLLKQMGGLSQKNGNESTQPNDSDSNEDQSDKTYTGKDPQNPFFK